MAIIDAHALALNTLPFRDDRDLVAAERGFLGTLDPLVITDAAGEVVRDGESYNFLQGEPPASVHPSLWRQSQLAARHGLFEVVPGVYQLRGFDLSNITFVEGETGVIVIDPLISSETAAAPSRCTASIGVSGPSLPSSTPTATPTTSPGSSA
ncbi:hypothetical protein [Microbacterium schleiferi]|uniref:hypothetical protein n=1 Tax=Microbacterium schleiferi TaxID=69362 RepID=UPI00311DBABD